MSRTLPFSEYDFSEFSDGIARIARGLCISGVRLLRRLSWILEGGRCFLRSSVRMPGVATGLTARGVAPFSLVTRPFSTANVEDLEW